MAPLRELPSRVGVVDTRIARTPEKRADPFYLTPQWRRLLADIIAERGRRCEDPAHRPEHPREGVRIYGDHVRELKDGGAPLDKANILLRCPPCHARKTANARAERFKAG